MTVSTNRNEPVTLPRGEIIGLLRIADVAVSARAVAIINEQALDLTTARGLAAMHEGVAFEVISEFLDEMERHAPKPPAQTYSDDEIAGIPRDGGSS